MAFDSDFLFKILAILGGESFIWKFYEQRNKSSLIPHLIINFRNNNVAIENKKALITFDFAIRNPTHKSIYVVFSRIYGIAQYNEISTEHIPSDDEYFTLAEKINGTPQLSPDIIFRHEVKSTSWAEFILSPLGSDFIFEPGEEWSSNFAIPVTTTEKGHIVQCRMDLLICETRPQIRFLRDTFENNVEKMMAVDEWDVEYRGDMYLRLLKMHKVLVFHQLQTFRIPAAPAAPATPAAPKATPAATAAPAASVAPAAPAVPKAAPAAPLTPAAPAPSAAPVTSATPAAPAPSVSSVTPVTQTTPAVPKATPVTPAAPVPSVTPAAPAAPVTSVTPATPVTSSTPATL